MGNKNNTSRLLSKVLRHKPEAIGLELDKNGWADVSFLLDKIEGLTMEILEEIVETNNKKRFAFSEDKSKIRANQGHSVENIDLQLEAVIPPFDLYHGTATKTVPLIMEDGISKMKRHAVHLSEDVETADNVGSRKGEHSILTIEAKRMHNDGYVFYRSENGVYLTEFVPLKYIKNV